MTRKLTNEEAAQQKTKEWIETRRKKDFVARWVFLFGYPKEHAEILFDLLQEKLKEKADAEQKKGKQKLFL